MTLSLGVVATSRKPDERRLAIHPAHVDRIDAELREHVVFEAGYGERFGVSDTALGARTAPREEVMRADVVLLPKPLPADLAELREGAVLWGWPHAVQDRELAQAAIDRRLTLIAWEAMHAWKDDGSFDVHVFHLNNELAGYCSVLHALSLIGRTGAYGEPLSAAVLSFGATARGAVRGLRAMGVDVCVYTKRDTALVASPFADVSMRQYDPDEDMGRTLSGFDVVVNCILQDPLDPVVFIRDADLDRFRPGSLFVDVSCDAGMGFEWARPTSFAEPTFTVGDRCTYYAVDHSPSYLWASTTAVISDAVLAFLPAVMAGPDAWEADATIRRAIEIRDGRVVNEAINEFQQRR